MFVDPSGEFVITLTAILIAMAIGAGVGATIGVATSLYKDSRDDGEINLSVGLDTYFAYSIGGMVAGAGIGVCAILGAAAGTATLLGSSATLFTTSGIGITFGSALAIGTGMAFVTGMAGYTIRTVISSSEPFNTRDMFVEGAFNAISGMFSVGGGYLVGYMGFRVDLASKLLSRSSDIFIRTGIQFYFTGGIKYGIGILKGQILY